MKPKYIICENKEERDAVLRKLERQGYVWVGEGEKPTEWNYSGWEYDETIYFNLSHSTRRISWGNVSSRYFLDEPEMLKITANNFLRNNRPILITRKGRVVTAEDKNTGEKAIATCSPTDTFDFGTGAMIAVARLIAKSDKGITKDAEAVLRQLLGDDVNNDVPTEAEPKPFKEGDLVTLRPDVTPGIEYNGLTLRPGEMYDTAFRKPIKVIRYDSGDQTYLCKAEGAERMWWYDSDMLEAWDESKPEMPTTKFNVGDLVTLKDDLEVHKKYGGLTLLENMYRNGHRKPIKVIDVSCSNNYDCVPFSSCDGSTVSYWYSEEMLEPWDESKIREGDKVHVKKGCTKDRYDTYYQWLKDNISDTDLLLGFERSDAISTTDTYTVVKIAPHEYFGGTQLAFIKRTNGIGDTFSYLYDIDSLEKVTEE